MTRVRTCQVCSSVASGTPALLVKGSGKAADFIAAVHAAYSNTTYAQGENQDLLRKAVRGLEGLSDEDVATIFRSYNMHQNVIAEMKNQLKNVVDHVKKFPKG